LIDRRWLLLLAACGGDDGIAREIHVRVSETSGGVTAVQPASACAKQFYPVELGTCAESAVDAEPCDGLNIDADACVFEMMIEGGERVSVDQRIWRGNALGATLVFTGCGNPVEVMLPVMAPAVPEAVAISTDAGTEVTWTSEAETMTVSASDATRGVTCRVAAGEGRVVLPIQADVFTVRAEGPTREQESEIGEIFVTAGAQSQVLP
jgi:hypothetical protein